MIFWLFLLYSTLLSFRVPDSTYQTPTNYVINNNSRGSHQDLTQPIYQTPFTGQQIRSMQVPSKGLPVSVSQRTRATLPPSPRPVQRTTLPAPQFTPHNHNNNYS